MTRDSSDYLTCKTKRNSYFPFLSFFPIYLCPTTSLIKRGQELKQKILTWPGMNKAGKQNSRGFLECAICQLIGFSHWRAIFPFMAWIRIATVLRGHQYNYTETVPIGKANHHLFYLFMHSYVKGYSFLDGSLLGQHTYLVEKLSLPREEPQVIFAIPAKEHFAGACAILVVCQ